MINLWDEIKYTIKNAAGWLWFHPQVSLIIGAAVFGVIILFFILGGIDSCKQKSREKKKSEINANIVKEQVETNVLTNQKQNINADLQNANRISQNTLENINAAKNRGLNSFSNNFDETLRRYCSKYPGDEGCEGL